MTWCVQGGVLREKGVPFSIFSSTAQKPENQKKGAFVLLMPFFLFYSFLTAGT